MLPVIMLSHVYVLIVSNIMLFATMLSVILMNAVAPMNVPLRPLNRGRRCKEKTPFFEGFSECNKRQGAKRLRGPALRSV